MTVLDAAAKAALVPTPNDDGRPRRFADFDTFCEALDFAAEGACGLNFHDARGNLARVYPYAALRADALTASLPALLAFHQSLAETDFRAELAALDLPVLVIQGDADATCPLDLTGRPTADLVKGARLVVVPGGTHGLVASHPALLAAAIAGFARGEG